MAVVMSLTTPAIQKAEDVKHTPYYDQVGVLTVCAGHTGPDVVVGKVYSADQCKAMTEQDIGRAATGVLKVSPQLIYHPIVLASIISFSYNVGVGTYDKSSVARDLNKGNFALGCKDLLKYTIAGGVVNKGLQNRRVQEYKTCMSTITPGGLKDAPPLS